MERSSRLESAAPDSRSLPSVSTIGQQQDQLCRPNILRHTAGNTTATLDNPRRNAGETESWIEIAQQPAENSSSSDERIITDGLRIATRRRRRSTPRAPQPRSNLAATVFIGTESEEEEKAEEDEIEDVASFSHSLPLSGSCYTTSSASTDDEGEAEGEESSGDSDEGRTIFANHHRALALPTRLVSKDEHDAALRASLTTLLSCAAAARGLSRSAGTDTSIHAQAARPSRGVEGLRVVQGNYPPPPPSSSSAASPPPPASQTLTSNHSAHNRQRLSRASPANSVVISSTKKPTSRDKKEKKHSAAIKRFRELTSLNVSLMTLAISAGAIVVLGAISFSAGYWMGKEIGKTEQDLLGGFHSASGVGGGGGSSRVVRQVGRVSA